MVETATHPTRTREWCQRMSEARARRWYLDLIESVARLDPEIVGELELQPYRVGRLMGCSPKTLRRMERDGLLRSRVTPGGIRRYTVADVQACIERAREEALNGHSSNGNR